MLYVPSEHLVFYPDVIGNGYSLDRAIFSDWDNRFNNEKQTKEEKV